MEKSRDIAAEVRGIVEEHMIPASPLGRALLAIADHIHEQQLRERIQHLLDTGLTFDQVLDQMVKEAQP